jgi:hypothetical protein
VAYAAPVPSSPPVASANYANSAGSANTANYANTAGYAETGGLPPVSDLPGERVGYRVTNYSFYNSTGNWVTYFVSCYYYSDGSRGLIYDQPYVVLVQPYSYVPIYYGGDNCGITPISVFSPN